MKTQSSRIVLAGVVLLLAFMAVLADGAARRESITFDEMAHIGAGVSYLQKLDMRMNEEHPPLAKVLAALPLVVRGVHARLLPRILDVQRQWTVQAVSRRMDIRPLADHSVE